MKPGKIEVGRALAHQTGMPSYRVPLQAAYCAVFLGKPPRRIRFESFSCVVVRSDGASDHSPSYRRFGPSLACELPPSVQM